MAGEIFTTKFVGGKGAKLLIRNTVNMLLTVISKSGNKKKALEISHHWRVYLALGMKDEALKEMQCEEYYLIKNPFSRKIFFI